MINFHVKLEIEVNQRISWPILADDALHALEQFADMAVLDKETIVTRIVIEKEEDE